MRAEGSEIYIKLWIYMAKERTQVREDCYHLFHSLATKIQRQQLTISQAYVFGVSHWKELHFRIASIGRLQDQSGVSVRTKAL